MAIRAAFSRFDARKLSDSTPDPPGTKSATVTGFVGSTRMPPPIPFETGIGSQAATQAMENKTKIRAATCLAVRAIANMNVLLLLHRAVWIRQTR